MNCLSSSRIAGWRPPFWWTTLTQRGAKNESNLLVVFSDPEALAQVRFTSFLRDTKALERPREELKAFEDREAQTILRYVNEQHDELLRSFGPHQFQIVIS